MQITHVYETIEESATRKPSREEEVLLLEKKKRALLHEMKILAVQIKTWVDAGHISQIGDKDKSGASIPDSESRQILTHDEILKRKILRTFERFTLVREILSNSVMPELAALEQKGETPKS